jgi:probable lipoprotein (TIGR04455 family)
MHEGRRSTLGRVVIMGAVAALGACSVVKSARIRDDWERVDRQRVKRLLVITQPLPDGNEKVGEMWSAIAARHVDLKRDFIIKEKLARGGEGPVEARALCVEGIEGVLWLSPDLRRAGRGVEAAVDGRLLRCADGEEVWVARAAGSWDSHEAGLRQTIQDYAAQFGPEVEPYVAASYHLLRAALDTLPNPVLTEEDQSDKIENSQ